MLGNPEHIELPNGHSFRVLRWARCLRETEVILGPGSVAPVRGEGEHWHYHVAMELTLFTSGEGTRFVGDSIAPFAEGDLVLIGKTLPHHWHVRGPSAGVSVQWDFPLGHPFWSFPESRRLGPLFAEASRGLRFKGGPAESLGAGLLELARTSGPDRLGLLFRLFARMADVASADRDLLSSQTFDLRSASAHEPAMAEAVRYLIANFRDEVRLEDVLRRTGMCKPTFSRQFKKHSGKTFSDFINHLRLDAVRRDLLETDRPVLEIALANGFTQVSFFNRVFRRIHGCSPSQLRASHRRLQN